MVFKIKYKVVNTGKEGEARLSGDTPEGAIRSLEYVRKLTESPENREIEILDCQSMGGGTY